MLASPVRYCCRSSLAGLLLRPVVLALASLIVAACSAPPSKDEVRAAIRAEHCNLVNVLSATSIRIDMRGIPVTDKLYRMMTNVTEIRTCTLDYEAEIEWLDTAKVIRHSPPDIARLVTGSDMPGFIESRLVYGPSWRPDIVRLVDQTKGLPVCSRANAPLLLGAAMGMVPSSMVTRQLEEAWATHGGKLYNKGQRERINGRLLFVQVWRDQTTKEWKQLLN